MCNPKKLELLLPFTIKMLNNEQLPNGCRIEVQSPAAKRKA